MNVDYNAIKTLLLVEEPHQAEIIAQHLRSADITISQCWVSTVSEFSAALQREKFDLAVIFTPQSGIDIPASILRYPDTPFLAIMEKYKNRIAEQLMSQGITEVLGYSHPVRFERVLKRLLSETKLRLENRALHDNQKSNRSMLNILLQNTEDAVAFVHQGMHCFGNAAYQKLTGYENQSDIVQTPLLDVVGADDHEKLTACIKKAEANLACENPLKINMIHRSGYEIPVKLKFTRSWFDGESVLQMIVSQHIANSEKNATNRNSQIEQYDATSLETFSASEFTENQQSDFENDKTVRIETYYNTEEISVIEDLRRLIGEDTSEIDQEDWEVADTQLIDPSAGDVSLAQTVPGCYFVNTEATSLDALLLDAGIALSFEPVTCLKADGLERHQLSLKNCGDQQIHLSRRLQSVQKLVGFEQFDLWTLTSSVNWISNNPLSQVFVPLLSNLPELKEFIRTAKQRCYKSGIPARAITLVADISETGATIAEKINCIQELHQSGFGVCLTGISNRTNEFRVLSTTPLDYMVLDHTRDAQFPDTSLGLEDQLAICQRADIKTIAAIENSTEIADIWHLGFDCFLTRPQQI